MKRFSVFKQEILKYSRIQHENLFCDHTLLISEFLLSQAQNQDSFSEIKKCVERNQRNPCSREREEKSERYY